MIKKIATCVPPQFYNFEDKINWFTKILKENEIDLFILPQEYFGGNYIMPDRPTFTKEELLPILEKLSQDTKTGLVVGLVERENNENYERMWFIDNVFKGELTKFAEPAYTVKGKGSYDLVPETDLDKRFQVFKIKDILLSGYFCWEVYSDLLFAGLGVLDLDLLVSQIKFGVSMSPKKEEKNGKIEVGGFNHFKDTSWKRRIEIINEFEVKCPIAISSNSWALPEKAEHLFGIQDVFTKRKYKIANQEQIENGVIDIQELDLEKTRGNREHWSSYLERTGEMPDGWLREYTMMWKIYNLERRLLGKSKDQLIFEKLKKMRFSRHIQNRSIQTERQRLVRKMKSIKYKNKK